MAESTYQPAAGFLTMAQARERLGISKVTLTALVREGKLKTYGDQRNKRVKLVREEDVDRLIEPVPNEDSMGKAAA